MNNKFTVYALITILAFAFVSCDESEEQEAPIPTATGKYIINYGNFSGAKSTITLVDTDNDSLVNDYYKSVNKVALTSNIQHAYNFNNNIYMMGNESDQVLFVDNKTFEQTKNAITTDIIKPRYGVGKGDYLYVSCWGGSIWADQSLSYIAKININTNIVETKIALPGGPEGLAIVNNKLYAALGYKDSVAVINLNNNAISYIITPAVSSYFVKDNNDNLYVSLVSTYADFSTETGLGYITTIDDKLESVYKLDDVSPSYANVLAPNDDFTKIYVMTSAYDASYNLSGAVATFDVSSKTFDTDMFVEGVSALNGIAVDDDRVLCFISEGVTGSGVVKSYKTDGTYIKDYATGIAPFMLLKY